MEKTAAENFFHFEQSIGVAREGRASNAMTRPIVYEPGAPAPGR